MVKGDKTIRLRVVLHEYRTYVNYFRKNAKKKPAPAGFRKFQICLISGILLVIRILLNFS
jgi:hypothetical protein